MVSEEWSTARAYEPSISYLVGLGSVQVTDMPAVQFAATFPVDCLGFAQVWRRDI